MDENKKENTGNQNNNTNNNRHTNNKKRHDNRNRNRNGQRQDRPNGQREAEPREKSEEKQREEVMEQQMEVAEKAAAAAVKDVDDESSEEVPDDGVDDNLSAEELAAIVKEHHKKPERHFKEDESSAATAPAENLDEYLDMDIRTPISEETKRLAANPFLTRGLRNVPDPEEINSSEYANTSCKLSTHNWMEGLDITTDYLDCPIAEVRFKNSHKDFFLLPQEGVFHVGDIVAVEATPGHDIGIISMLGKNVYRQLAHKRVKVEDVKKKLYRTARYSDIEKWISTVNQEHTTMLSSRYIAWDLGLKMKVNDVEYQGDGTKAIFYYSAEDRVDFRELIKILAEQFHIRIEMRQIGVRQEAGRLGGIGTCGRELCCSSWLTNFQSVSTASARTQQLSLNPQKLAGQCGKLKCCLNFEQATYQEELKDFPPANVKLKFKKGNAHYSKIDIFKKIVWYSYYGDNTIFAIPLDKVNEIIEMNKKNQFPETLEEFAIVNQKKVDEVKYSLDELKNIEDK
jgi:cell fate regulator YaaT (PSP1 superfamily)